MDKITQNTNWNECVYLYRTYGFKHLEELLNNFYFNHIFKIAISSLNKYSSLYEYDDLLLIGHQYFKNSIDKINYKNKNFVKWSINSVLNGLRNEIRKTKGKRNIWNHLTFTSPNLLNNTPDIDKSFEHTRKNNYEKIAFLTKEINKIKSNLFIQILKYKTLGYTFERIAKELNIRFDQVRGCWNYYRKIIFNNYKKSKESIIDI